MNAYTIKLDPVVALTDEAFYRLCRANPDVKFERSPQGELIVMSPTGGEGGRRNADITTDLNLWNRHSQLGYTFDSSTGFQLPNGATRSPDAAWIARDRWEALSPEAREKFPPIAPDFLIELRSATDALPELQAKMREYQENGVQLGWLLNPQDQQVEIYRLEQATEILQSPQTLSGESVLPDFVLSLERIF